MELPLRLPPALMNRQHIKTHLKRKDEEIKDLENSTEPQSRTLMIRQATGGAGADHIQLKVKTAAGPKQLQSPDLSCCSWWWAAGGDTHIGPESSDKTVWLGYEPPPDRTQPETLSYVRFFFVICAQTPLTSREYRRRDQQAGGGEMLTMLTEATAAHRMPSLWMLCD